MRAFLKKTYDAQVAALFANAGRRYRLSLVTNAAPAHRRGRARRRRAPARPTSRRRPSASPGRRSVFSLSHLAVPFALDDPLFGIEPDMSVDYGVRLGLLAPRGERGVLDGPTDQFMRLNCNPFFPYVEKRIEEFVGKK